MGGIGAPRPGGGNRPAPPGWEVMNVGCDVIGSGWEKNICCGG